MDRPATGPGARPAGRLPRVAIVSHVFAPHTGGTELHHEVVARELSRRAEVEVFTSAAMLRGPEGPRAPATPGFPVRYLPSHEFLGEHLVAAPTLWSALARFDPDVLWSNHPSLTADFGGGYAVLHAVPWIATYHADLARSRVYAVPYNRLEALALRRAETVLVNAENYRRRLAGRGLPAARVVAVAPGLGIGRGEVPPDPGPGLAEDAEPGPAHPFLFVGGLDRAREYKQPEVLLAAVRRLRAAGVPVFLDVVGDGDRRAELEQRSAAWGLQGAVAFLGSVTDDELAERYRSSWALVLPSTDSEGFGLVAIEAAYYGCPVVCSDGAAAGSVLAAAGCATIFRTGDVAGLAELMGSLWRDRALRRKMSDATRAIAPRLTWDAALPSIVAPILSAANRHHAARTVSQ